MPETESEELEATLCMIKPDAVRNNQVSAIEKVLLESGFVILAKKRFQFVPEKAAEFYAEHKGKEFFERLVTFMSSGPAYALALSKPNAIQDYRKVIVETLRPQFGTDGTMNAVHGSDSPASARRELRFHFPGLLLEPLPNTGQAKTYVMDKLQPTLISGLTELCRARPEQSEAVAWLAHWLKANNPYLPKKYNEWEVAYDTVEPEIMP